jgi:lipopolysaccharide/colanic/teichoic acid biosynthesis glycosyltransferase
MHPYHNSVAKRWFDIVLALGLLVGLCPLLIAIAGIVFITAGSPVFYSQKRTGKHNREFSVFKFRTMVMGAEKNQKKLQAQNEAPYPMFKLHNDPRFVGVGRWLSNTGLDELPQLWNILRGEMSFVGPRPLPVNESKKLLLLKPAWQFRTLVKPGIFSEWSIDQRRHQSLARWQKLDALTVSQGGLFFELKLIAANAVGILLWTAKTSLIRFLKLLRGELNAQSS